MFEREHIRDAVFQAVDKVRESLPDESALPSDESTALLGEGATLDSMGFVNFVVAVEEEMSQLTDRPFHLAETLTAPDTEAQSISTVGQFIDFLHRLVTL
jgi:acyl carrier protein